MNLKEGSGYVLYVDESNYQMVKHDGKDRIIPKIKLEPTLPEVYLEIQHVKGKPPMDMVPLIEYKLKSSFENVENYGTVEQPIKAISLHAHNELASHAPVVTYYIVDDNQGGSYVIEQHLFLEAAEGHGVRFYHMLKEFKVVNPRNSMSADNYEERRLVFPISFFVFGSSSFNRVIRLPSKRFVKFSSSHFIIV